MIAILDIQHLGGPNPRSLGASFDLNGDGSIEQHEHEARLTPYYAAACSYVLAIQGIPVAFEPVQPSSYVQRHHRAVQLARMHPERRIAYIACHVNAGAGDYAACFYHGDRPHDIELCTHVADNLRPLPELSRSLVFPACGDDWTMRARSCLSGLADAPRNLSAMVLEPCFIDQPKHRDLLTGEGLRRIGGALAAGIISWGRSQIVTNNAQRGAQETP